MTVRVLPGAFGLEFCPLNRNKANLEMSQNPLFYNGRIGISAWQRSALLGLGVRVLLFSLKPASARAIMAFQQGLRVVCSMNNAICMFHSIIIGFISKSLK